MARLEIIVDGVSRFAEDVDSVAFTHHNWTNGDGGVLELTASMPQSKAVGDFVLGPSGTVVDGLMVAPTLGVKYTPPEPGILRRTQMIEVPEEADARAEFVLVKVATDASPAEYDLMLYVHLGDVERLP